MKILCSKENLLYGVNVVQRAVSSKNPLPILSGILFRTEENHLVLTATDLEIGIECRVPVTVVQPGSIVIPAKYITELVKKLPDAKIELATNNESLVANIKYGVSELEIKGLPAEEYPLLPEVDASSQIKIVGDIFKTMVKQVGFATSTDSNRPIFTGVLLETEENNLTMVATNTHRLTWSKRAVAHAGTEKVSIIVPVKTLNEVSKLVTDDEELVIFITDNQILFQVKDIRVISRLIDGQFPNYHQVIPTGYKTRIRIKTSDLADSSDRAALMAREGSNIIKLSVKNHVMEINSNSPDFGKIHEELPVLLEGEETQIAFNSKYLLDVLKIINTDEIFMDLTGSLSPGIIRPADVDNYLCLILPLRTV